MASKACKTLCSRVSQTCTATRARNVPASRSFSTQSPRLTDGVYKELTNQRVPTPWIEAFRRKQDEEQGKTKSSTQKAASPAETRNLTPKRMKDSYFSVVLPLAQDPWMSDKYLNATGHIRIGTLLMDLDALSGVIAYRHTGDSVTTVTASFDRITLLNPLEELCDLELSGEVTYAGTSSMEIALQVSRAREKGAKVKREDVLVSCSCTMVSLDPVTKRPVKINPLIVETEEEKRLVAIGEKNSKNRKALKQSSLVKYTPNDEESDLIHELWKKQLQWHDPNDPLRRPPHVHWTDTTVQKTTTIMQPQYRNRHNFQIFGGYLLKSAFELAFCTAASFSHCRPLFVSLDPSTFQNPVPVGSVLYLTATVTYTEPVVDKEGDGKRTRVSVRVDSKVRDVEHGETKPTGQFCYTFVVDKEIEVAPRTYTEMMMWVDARRRSKRVAELMGDLESVVVSGVME